MSQAVNMLVPLQDLPATRRIVLASDMVSEVIAEMPTRAILDRPADDPDAGGADVTVDLHSDGDGNVHLRGQLSGWFTVACSRCIEPVRFAFTESLLATFRRAGVPLPTSPDSDDDDDLDSELFDQELDVYSHDGEHIDLEPLLREQLVLAMPVAPLCAEECKGLCAQCGVNKNHDTCACEEPVDPRLSALRKLVL